MLEDAAAGAVALKSGGNESENTLSGRQATVEREVEPNQCLVGGQVPSEGKLQLEKRPLIHKREGERGA